MFGLHISKTDSISSKSYRTHADSIESAIAEFGIQAAQIYTHGPQSPRRNAIQAGNQVKIFVHGSYICVGVWSALLKWKSLIRSEMEAAADVGAAGLVVHLKSAPIGDIADICGALHREIGFPLPLLLETPATKAKINNFSIPENLAALARYIPKAVPWGICVDTAHLWASGINVAIRESMEAWLEAMPSERIQLIHLNSNKTTNFGTGADLHIIPFSEQDGIWLQYCGKSIQAAYKDGRLIHSKISKLDRDLLMSSGFAAIVQFAKKNNIACIGEVNRGYTEDIRFFKSVYFYI